jgi:hypothetical protein
MADLGHFPHFYASTLTFLILYTVNRLIWSILRLKTSAYIFMQKCPKTFLAVITRSEIIF